MYLFWTGNRFYTIKTLGSPQECIDKFIFGVLIASGVLFLLIGPFYMFSSMSPYIQFNPVLQGNLNLNFQVNKTIWLDPNQMKIFEPDITTDSSLDNPDEMFDEEKAKKQKKKDMNIDWQYINSSMPYNFYSLTNPFLKDFDKEMW